MLRRALRKRRVPCVQWRCLEPMHIRDLNSSITDVLRHSSGMPQRRRCMGNSLGCECLLPQENKKEHATSSNNNLFHSSAWLLACLYWENHNKPTHVLGDNYSVPKILGKTKSLTERHLYVFLELDWTWTAPGNFGNSNVHIVGNIC